MRMTVVAVTSFFVMLAGMASGALIPIDISPPPGLALNTTNYLLGDHTTGLSAPNAVGQPGSQATGDEIGAGITFDTITKVLSYDIAYGSAFGFVDLAGNYTAAHIHGPVAVQFPLPNTGAGPVVGLTHTPSGPRSGRFTSSTVLGAAAEANLLNNLLYINVHSGFAAGGEIRGQLVAVPEPASAWLVALGGALLLRLRRSR